MGAISALLFAEQLSRSDAGGLRCSCSVGLNPQVEVTVFFCLRDLNWSDVWTDGLLVSGFHGWCFLVINTTFSRRPGFFCELVVI